MSRADKYSDGITVSGKHSFNNFELYISERTINSPKKKTIRETIPFMNGSYDFSKVNGAVAFEDREIEYAFEIIGESIADMDQQRDSVLNWLMNVYEEALYDDTMPDYHFLVSYDDCKVKEDAEKTDLTVTFIAYPFKIYNTQTSFTASAGTTVVNNQGQPVVPNVIATEEMTITLNGQAITVPAGTQIKLEVDLMTGDNTVIVSGSGELTLSFIKEVL